MKKLLILLTLSSLALVLFGCDFLTQSTTTTTAITTEAVYVDIATASELAAIEMDKNYRLTADIDLLGVEWEPLGTPSEPFSGIFDGNDFTISNFIITQKNFDFNGLFGVVMGSIQNLSVLDFNIDYQTDFLTYAGGVVGSTSGDLVNIHAEGTLTIVSTQSNVFAGLVAGFISAYVTSTTTVVEFRPNVVEHITASGTLEIDGKNYVYVGGLAGKAYNTEITDVTIEVTILAANDAYQLYAGGLLGHNFGGILIGYEDMVESTEIVLSQIIVNAQIQASSAGSGMNIGGLIGYNQHGVIRDNAVNAFIEVHSNPFILGALIGDDWNGVLTNNLAYADYVIDLNASGLSYTFGTLIGRTNEGSEITNSFYGYTNGITPVTENGTFVLLSDLQNEAWYQTNQLFSDHLALRAIAIDLFS